MLWIDLDIAAVLAAALAAFAVGTLWYSPLGFGRRRSRGAAATVVAGLCAVATAMALTVILSWSSTSSLADALVLSFLVWLGFPVAVGLVHAVDRQQGSMQAFWIDSGYHLAGLLVMAVVLSWLR